MTNHQPRPDNTVPPKTWRSVNQLRGYLGTLKAAELTVDDDGRVILDLKTIYALREIICQAIHGELLRE
jgi:hypothetical protein